MGSGLVFSVVLILSLAGLTLGLKSRWQTDFRLALFTAVMGISLWLYLAALLGLLRVGLVVSLVVGLVLLAWQGLKVLPVRRWRSMRLKPRILVLGGIYAVPVVVVLASVGAGYRLSRWDEFSHWGLSAKWIHSAGQLWNADSPVVFPRYPPGQQLAQYAALAGLGYSEAALVIAQSALILVAGLAVASTMVRNPIASAVAFSFTWLWPYAFGLVTISALNDVLLGMVFAASFALAWRGSEIRGGRAAFVLSLAFLVLLKEFGLVLALVAWGTAMLRRFVERDSRSSLLRATGMEFAAIALTWLSWRMYVTAIGVGVPDAGATEGIGQLLTGARASATLTEFVARSQLRQYPTLVGYPAVWIVSLVGLVTLLVALSVTASIVARTPRKRAIVGVVALFLGLVVYASALAWAYLRVFSEYEGVRLASMERYLATYLFPWSMLLTFQLVDTAPQFVRTMMSRRWQRVLGVIAAVGLGMALAGVVPRVASNFAPSRLAAQDASVLELRAQVDRLMAIAPAMDPSSGVDVAFLDQGSVGLSFNIFRYEGVPSLTVREPCFSVGAPKFEADVWTCPELSTAISSLDYVAVFAADAELWKPLGAPVDVQINDDEVGWYRVTSDGLELVARGSRSG